MEQAQHLRLPPGDSAVVYGLLFTFYLFQVFLNYFSALAHSGDVPGVVESKQ